MIEAPRGTKISITVRNDNALVHNTKYFRTFLLLSFVFRPVGAGLRQPYIPNLILDAASFFFSSITFA